MGLLRPHSSNAASVVRAAIIAWSLLRSSCTASTVVAAIDNGVISGRITFTDACGSVTGVLVQVELRYIDGTEEFTEDHQWHVHANSEPDTASERSMQMCNWAGGHWDPEQREVAPYACDRNEPAGCYRGDMSGKLGTLSVDGRSTRVGGRESNEEKFTSPDITIATADLLGRSIVIHGGNFSSTRIACAGIYPDTASFPTEDQQLVEGFYQAVDAKDFGTLRRLTAVNYEAVFSPGCAAVGGAFHEGEETLSYQGLRRLLDGAPANDGVGMSRSFISEGSGVVLNHYDVVVGGGERRVHGAAVHTTQDRRVISSFWYGGSGSCSGLNSMASGWEEDLDEIGSKGALFVLLVLVFVAIGISLDGYLQHRGVLYLPGASVTMLLGVGCGAFLRSVGDEKLEEVLEFDAELFVIVLLPLIIFEAGYALDKVGFFSNLLPICTFAILGTLVSTLLIAPAVYFAAVVSFASDPDGVITPVFTYTEALAFAALISAVDPVSTIAIFGKLGVDRTTSVILLGESILNDAVAIVFYRYASAAVIEEETMSAGDVLMLLIVVLWSFCISLLLGALAGIFGTFLVGRATAGAAHSNAQLQVSLVLLFAYIAYELAETLEFSGIVAALAAGIVTKRYAYTHMDEEGRALSKQSFGMLAKVRPQPATVCSVVYTLMLCFALLCSLCGAVLIADSMHPLHCMYYCMHCSCLRRSSSSASVHRLRSTCGIYMSASPVLSSSDA